ncbi:MAG: hypothetical protein A2189_00550 [Paenibacillus sp. RIFOXYA1_FULL_44_5]|nr:MAG: hypothetical protein A2189_00550 [Paenibacillus sp. RIFOXYA1_FULL_44_5]
MINDEMIARVNELARKANSIGLSSEEIAERDELRKKYVQAFRASLKAQLDNIEIVDESPKIKH